MKELKIIAKTPLGTKALKKHYEGSLKLRTIHKIQFRAMGYKQVVESQEPFTLSIQITNKYFQNTIQSKDFEAKVNETMGENGAKNNKDYEIQIT